MRKYFPISLRTHKKRVAREDGSLLLLYAFYCSAFASAFTLRAKRDFLRPAVFL